MASAVALPVAQGGWRGRAPLLLLVLALVLVGLRATIADMVGVWWTSSTFNHCFLIAPIAFGLGWTRRAQLAGVAPGLSWWGCAYALANAALWLAGAILSIAFVQHVAAIGLLIGAGWALLGGPAFRILLVPFLYLYFCVPEGEFLVPKLQDWTASVLVGALQLTGIPVYVEGRHLTIPSGSFVVAEACSGINYLIATLAVGTMFMYLNFRSPWRRALFMALALAVPLVANGLRAYGIVMIAHLSDYRYAVGIDHFIYGWVFFGVVIFALFALGNRFSDVQEIAPPAVAEATSSVPAAASAVQLGLVVALLAIAALTPPVLLETLAAHRPLAPAITLPSLPGWQGPAAASLDLGARHAGRDQSLVGEYRDADGVRVWVSIDYFRSEGEGKELVNQLNHAFDAQRWQQLDYAERVPAAESDIAQVSEAQLRNVVSGEEVLLWSWYDTHGHRSNARLTVKLAQAAARLAGAHAGGAVISVATPMGADTDGAAVLNRFLGGAGLALERMYLAP